MLFERREDGRLWPKRWTRSRPPALTSERFWSRPYVAAIAAAVVGLLLYSLGDRGLASWLFWGGIVAMGGYTLLDARRQWQAIRWKHSPPTGPTPPPENLD